MTGFSFRSLHLSLRFILPLALALALLAYAVVPLVDKLMLRWSVRDMDIRSRLISSAIQEPLADLLKGGERKRISSLLMRVNQDERLLGLGICSEDGQLLYKSQTFPELISCSQPVTMDQKGPAHFVRLPQGPVHLSLNQIDPDDPSLGSLIIIHDMSFMERRSADTRRYVIILFTVLGVVISLITVFVAHLSWRGWMEGVRAILRGEGILRPFGDNQQRQHRAELQPLVGDLRKLIRSLEAERRFADDATIFWSAEGLRRLLHKELSGEQVLVVSNREPYIHSRSEGGAVRVKRPASGLVTAVEPVMKACSGTWIAHGSGDADRQVVDADDRVGVPPEKPAYTLRRIWISKEEEDGYYYGFANEGLWPLCHIAHVRPVFRLQDWKRYVEVNQRFADAVVKEAKGEDPVVLVQDYHLALVPAFIRKVLPRATVITFWHIPWPNPESFGICPWREELLQGMLGSTILGFHTPFHCKNFIETVDRYLEARIEHETSTICHNGKLTLVENYPISIQWPSPWQEQQPTVEQCAVAIRSELGLEPDTILGLGVDRLDYTKGILERFWAVERMLELHPELVGRFSFVQIAAPTRAALDDYQSFDARVRALAMRINKRFGKAGWQPLILRIEHHEPEDVNRFYRASNLCMVTSLHDGMNLVAKEYVAARDDEQGALVLSQFAGAANELHEALLVNPYNIEQTAEALYEAVTMPPYEQQERMRSMRALVRDFNVFRWAGRMLLDAARIRQREKFAARIGTNVRQGMF